MFAIVLSPKFGGANIYLGVKHATREAAREYADAEVCQRCNRVTLIPVDADAEWTGKHSGWSRPSHGAAA